MIEPLEVSKNPAFTDDENFYLSYLKRFNVPIPNEKSMVELGHSICDLLRYSDDDYAKVAMTIARESEGTFTVDDATTMTGAVKGGGLCG